MYGDMLHAQSRSPAGGRVGGSQHGGPGLEHGGDAGLGDGDGLLLHGLVDGYAVLRPHLVKLINADHAIVCEHHGASLHGIMCSGLIDSIAVVLALASLLIYCSMTSWPAIQLLDPQVCNFGPAAAGSSPPGRTLHGCL